MIPLVQTKMIRHLKSLGLLRQTFRRYSTTVESNASASSKSAPASTPPAPPKSSSFAWTASISLAALAGGASLYYYQQVRSKALDYHLVAKGLRHSTFIRVDVAALLESDVDYDGLGHFGPLLIRLAWHSSGTYTDSTKTGGSNGASMRFEPESKFAANNGLVIARTLLEPVKKKYGEKLSYGDLWTLAGVVALKELGGPSVKWMPGRVDAVSGLSCPKDGLLPDPTKGLAHIREIFHRMGFNDRDIVALSGAHVLGKCHADRSGFKGPWSFSPTTFSNDYFKLLLSETWIPKKKDVTGDGKVVAWTGPLQYEDKATGSLMMLPTDLALIQDSATKTIVKLYATDSAQFFNDFASAFGKLLELGVVRAGVDSVEYQF